MESSLRSSSISFEWMRCMSCRHAAVACGFCLLAVQQQQQQRGLIEGRCVLSACRCRCRCEPACQISLSRSPAADWAAPANHLSNVPCEFCDLNVATDVLSRLRPRPASSSDFAWPLLLRLLLRLLLQISDYEFVLWPQAAFTCTFTFAFKAKCGCQLKLWQTQVASGTRNRRAAAARIASVQEKHAARAAARPSHREVKERREGRGVNVFTQSATASGIHIHIHIRIRFNVHM